MIFKVTSFHVYAHEDNTSDTIENCQICELAVQNQSLEFLPIAIVVFLTTAFLTPYREISFSSVTESSSSFLRFRLFGRPPPQIN